MLHEHGRLRSRRGITVLNLVLLILAVVIVAVLVSRQL
jgi:Tfp pilus assembly protein PilE